MVVIASRVCIFCNILSSSICIPMIASAQSGIASVYNEGTHTASGGATRTSALTAAHRTCRSYHGAVTNEGNGRSVTVRTTIAARS